LFSHLCHVHSLRRSVLQPERRNKCLARLHRVKHIDRIIIYPIVPTFQRPTHKIKIFFRVQNITGCRGNRPLPGFASSNIAVDGVP
jgi:hypothetical protein